MKYDVVKLKVFNRNIIVHSEGLYEKKPAKE
jgi:hypothetical protein